LILRDLEEMSYEEIAEVMNVSLGTVKSRLTRGREALKRRLTGYIREVVQSWDCKARKNRQEVHDAAWLLGGRKLR